MPELGCCETRDKEGIDWDHMGIRERAAEFHVNGMCALHVN